MWVEFDQAKDKANQAKHGVGLALARHLDWSMTLVKVDDRNDYDEVREIGYGPIADRLYCVVFTRRGDGLRIISLRKANNREFDRYVRQIETQASRPRRKPEH